MPPKTNTFMLVGATCVCVSTCMCWNRTEKKNYEWKIGNGKLTKVVQSFSFQSIRFDGISNGDKFTQYICQRIVYTCVTRTIAIQIHMHRNRPDAIVSKCDVFVCVTHWPTVVNNITKQMMIFSLCRLFPSSSFFSFVSFLIHNHSK